MPANAGSPGSSSEKYQAQYTSTSAPMPETTSTITHCSDPIANARSRRNAGTQLTTSVFTRESATARVPASAQATAAAGTSASTRKARLPKELIRTGARAAATKCATTRTNTPKILRQPAITDRTRSG